MSISVPTSMATATAATAAVARTPTTAPAATIPVIRWWRRRRTIVPIVRPQRRELEPYPEVFPRPGHEGLDRLGPRLAP